MGAKVGNLNELSNILRQKDSADEKVLSFSKQFNVGQLLKPFSARVYVNVPAYRNDFEKGSYARIGKGKERAFRTTVEGKVIVLFV